MKPMVQEGELDLLFIYLGSFELKFQNYKQLMFHRTLETKEVCK